MATGLLVMAIVLGALGLQLHYWPTVVVRLGPRFFLHTRAVAWAVRVAVISLALAGYAAEPSAAKAAAVLISCVLAAGAGFFAPRRALPVLEDPAHERAETAPLADEALVLGRSDEQGRCVAWPVEMLIAHHVVHDRVGEQRVVATWCQACRSGVVYAANVDGAEVELEIASVYRRNMVVRDRRTGSIFQQATGECIAGPLEGRSLSVLSAELVRFGAWRSEHPETQVALEPERWAGLVPKRVIAWMLERATRRVRTPGLVALDDRLPAEAPVVGVVCKGVAAAWTIEALRLARSVRATVGGVELSLGYDASTDRVRVWRGHDDAPTSAHALIPHVRGYWAGWVEFHPESELHAR